VIPTVVLQVLEIILISILSVRMISLDRSGGPWLIGSDDKYSISGLNSYGIVGDSDIMYR
jgi:hypothetical protein